VQDIFSSFLLPDGLIIFTFRRKLKQGNSSKKTNNKPFHGIQELGGDDLTFDRDLNMKINNLAVTHDTGQFALRHPFLVQEDNPTLSEVPIDNFTAILEEEESPKDQSKKKSRWLSFLARLKRKKNRLCHTVATTVFNDTTNLLHPNPTFGSKL